MRKLCFGGSFNPIHYGHICCARAAAEKLGFERVELIPSAQPPHKLPGANLAAADHRLAMCRMAVASDKLFSVNDIEMRRNGKSYTIQTARQLKHEGWPEVNWLIGADMLNSLPTWRDPDALLREVSFIVMARPGFHLDWSSLGPEYQQLQQNVVEVPAVNISATGIRQKVANGQSIDGLTPHTVVEYIRRHRLYLPEPLATT